MKWIFQRLKEPSTWAGFAGLIPSAIALVDSPSPAAIGGLVSGIAAVLMKEGGHVS